MNLRESKREGLEGEGERKKGGTEGGRDSPLTPLEGTSLADTFILTQGTPFWTF